MTECISGGAVLSPFTVSGHCLRFSVPRPLAQDFCVGHVPGNFHSWKSYTAFRTPLKCHLLQEAFCRLQLEVVLPCLSSGWVLSGLRGVPSNNDGCFFFVLAKYCHRGRLSLDSSGVPSERKLDLERPLISVPRLEILLLHPHSEAQS